MPKNDLHLLGALRTARWKFRKIFFYVFVLFCIVYVCNILYIYTYIYCGAEPRWCLLKYNGPKTKSKRPKIKLTSTWKFNAQKYKSTKKKKETNKSKKMGNKSRGAGKNAVQCPRQSVLRYKNKKTKATRTRK